MEFWTNVIVFFLLLIFYLHLQHEWKKSGDLEIFEMDYISNTDLEEVCKLKQPVLFQVDHLREMDFLLTFVPDEKEEVIIKDIRDYYKPDIIAVDGICLSYKSAFGLCSTDTNQHFFSENNTEIMDKWGDKIKKMDGLLAPSLKFSTKYDYWFGSSNAYTPTRYHYDTSRFLLVLPGQGIRIKMCPWQNANQLYPIKDYEHYEFWSKIDLWKNTKIKSLEFDVKPGFMMYIPSYWFYTIQYINIEATEDTRISSILCFQYTTIMNVLSNLHHYGMYFLQQQNIIHTKSRKIEIEESVVPMPIKDEIIKVENKKIIKDEITESIAMLQPKNDNEIKI